MAILFHKDPISKEEKEKRMSLIIKFVQVDVPVRTAYDQWRQFEEFPQFMEGVRDVKKLDDRRLHWRAEVGGQEREWDAVITEQIPDQQIGWQSMTGVAHAVVVSFHRLSDTKSRVMMQMDFDPNGDDTLGIVSQQVENTLDQFKALIEKRDEGKPKERSQ